MATAPKFVAKGVIPATLIAFDQDYAIDQKNSLKHLRDVAATDNQYPFLVASVSKTFRF